MFGGGNFARNKFATKPVGGPAVITPAGTKPSAPCKIGQNQLIELQEQNAEMMTAPHAEE